MCIRLLQILHFRHFCGEAVALEIAMIATI